MNNKLLCIGQMGWDITTINHQTMKSFGGSVVHFSLASSLFNLKFDILSYVDRSEWKDLLDIFNKVGINTSRIIDFNDTIAFTMFYDSDLNFINEKFVLNKSLNEPILTNEFPSIYDEYDHIHFCPIPGQDFKYLQHVKNENPNASISFQVHITALIKFPEEYKNAFESVDILFMNKNEAQFITNTSNIESAIEVLMKNEGKTYVISAHDKNTVVSDGDLYFSNILEANVIDPTGAGDSFAGGFISGYLIRQDIDIALRYGTISATIKLSDFSSRALHRFLE